MIILNMNELKKTDNLHLRKLSDKYYVFGTEVCFELNELGAVIFRYIGSDMPISNLLIGLKKRFNYDISEERIQHDIYDFIDNLINLKLVKINE